MPINFPASPNNGDFHEEVGRKWTWDGSKWNAEAYITSSTVKEIRTVSGNTTLLADDAGQIIRFTGTSPQTLTIPDVLAPGSSVTVIQDNSGLVSFASSGNVNLLSPTGIFDSSGQNSIIEILCLDANEYRITGDVPTVLPFSASGGSQSDSNGYRYHTFTANGTFEAINSPGEVEILVVAGGGGGGGGYQGGGGGAGGYVQTSLTIDPGSYPILIGAGGRGATSGSVNQNGNNTSFGTSTIVAIGGGMGSGEMQAYGAGATINAAPGGSGGGTGHPAYQSAQSGTQPSQSGISGSAGFGNSGGTNWGGCCSNAGGGGANSAGAYAPSNNNAGAGGSGKQWLNGTYYAGGGGGANRGSGTRAAGGIGGGGAGGNDDAGTAGSANTGGGGGGGGSSSGTGPGGAGGSGIVIIRYPI